MQTVRNVDTTNALLVNRGVRLYSAVMRRLLRAPGVMPALIATLALRIATSCFAAFIAYALHDTYLHVSREINTQGATLGLTVIPTTLSGPAAYLTSPWLRWDANIYVTIAEHGYGWYRSTAYMPLYPLLIHAVGVALGGHFVVASLLISTVATFVMFILLYRLVLRLTTSPQTATYSLVIVCLLPIAFFFVAPYTESLFLVFSFATMLAVMDRRWRRAAFFALLASLTRQQGVLLGMLVVPELAQAVRHEWLAGGTLRRQLHDGWRIHRGAVAVILAAVGAYALWILILVLWLRAQAPWQVLTAKDAWNQHFTVPGSGLVRDMQLIVWDPKMSFVLRLSLLLDVVAAALGAVGLWLVRKRLPAGLLLYFAACWCVALVKVAADGSTNSAARYLLALLPVCIVPAIWLARGRPIARLAYIGCSLIVWCVFLTNWVLWSWVN